MPTQASLGGSSTTPANSRSLRQSCDRCHTQKLKCLRRPNESGDDGCQRCHRARVECVYRRRAPTGRPLKDKSTVSCPESNADEGVHVRPANPNFWQTENRASINPSRMRDDLFQHSYTIGQHDGEYTSRPENSIGTTATSNDASSCGRTTPLQDMSMERAVVQELLVGHAQVVDLTAASTIYDDPMYTNMDFFSEMALKDPFDSSVASLPLSTSVCGTPTFPDSYVNFHATAFLQVDMQADYGSDVNGSRSSTELNNDTDITNNRTDDESHTSKLFRLVKVLHVLKDEHVLTGTAARGHAASLNPQLVEKTLTAAQDLGKLVGHLMPHSGSSPTSPNNIKSDSKHIYDDLYAKLIQSNNFFGYCEVLDSKVEDAYHIDDQSLSSGESGSATSSPIDTDFSRSDMSCPVSFSERRVPPSELRKESRWSHSSGGSSIDAIATEHNASAPLIDMPISLMVLACYTTLIQIYNVMFTRIQHRLLEIQTQISSDLHLAAQDVYNSTHEMHSMAQRSIILLTNVETVMQLPEYLRSTGGNIYRSRTASQSSQWESDTPTLHRTSVSSTNEAPRVATPALGYLCLFELVIQQGGVSGDVVGSQGYNSVPLRRKIRTVRQLLRCNMAL